MGWKKTIIIRHAHENLKKCSLRGLEGRSDLIFHRYPHPKLGDLSGYCLLSIEGEELSAKDEALGLLLLDGTWRYTGQMHKVLGMDHLPKRSLPRHFKTAYPRRQGDCSHPQWGLASVEALAIAYFILNRPLAGLLDHYYWRASFLEKNSPFLPF